MYCSTRDYCSTLGVSGKAERGETRHAFGKLAMKDHPDGNRGNEEWAGGEFKEITEAYAVLGVEAKDRESGMMKQTDFAGCDIGYTGWG
jgi:DnaJ-class molecular chaperone